MKEIKAVLCGYYGKGNAGDEALLASLLQMLPPYVEPIVLSGNPRETSDRYGVESYNRMNPFSVIKILRQSDAFIWGGGSLMQDATSIRNPLYYGGLMALAQKMGLITIALAQGIGPLKRKISQSIAKNVLEKCYTVTVRDRASANLLFNWDISCITAPDLVWTLDSIPVKGLEDIEQPIIAVTLRPHPQLTPQRLDHLTYALIDLQKAIECHILLVPFQISQDLTIAQEIQSNLQGSNQILCIEDPRELKGLFQYVDLAIGMRYHSLIMAASAKCRCFAISYDPKVTQLMQEIEMPGWELSQIPDAPTIITETWLEYYHNSKSFEDEQIQFLSNQALIHRDLLIESLLLLE